MGATDLDQTVVGRDQDDARERPRGRDLHGHAGPEAAPNRDDPAQRGVIETNRQKAVAELARLTKSVQADKKGISDLMEEARRAGVPPGWLR